MLRQAMVLHFVLYPRCPVALPGMTAEGESTELQEIGNWLESRIPLLEYRPIRSSCRCVASVNQDA